MSPAGIGVDVGTFHTVAVLATGYVRIPPRSIPSIALRASTPIVGVDAIPQLELPFELIQAPKLSLGRNGEEDPVIQQVIRKLVEQALMDLGEKPTDVVLTVPPAWTLEQCKRLLGAIEPLGVKVRFIHEPIALLIASMYLALKHAPDPRVAGKLDGAELVLTCDWGAGTVDIGLIHITRRDNRHEFACVGELTELGQGGTSIARDAVQEHELDKGRAIPPAGLEKIAYRLQGYWQGERYAAVDFAGYESIVRQRRQQAARTIGRRIEKMFESLGITDVTGVLCLLHGGPLESAELRSFLEGDLQEHLKLSRNQFLHIGNDFTASLHATNPQWRRDVLVATGAALFAARGEVLPEFEYDVRLKDSFGQVSSCARLAQSHNLRGIQVVTPPFTGVDYYADVQQIRRKSPKLDHLNITQRTAIRTELRLYVRPDAVVRYQIREAGVGYTLIEAVEAQNLPNPIPFTDACSDQQCLPERSTRFLIDLE